jgi:hypothetical protein
MSVSSVRRQFQPLLRKELRLQRMVRDLRNGHRAPHEGATDEQDARSAAKWRAGKLEQVAAWRASPV